MKLIAGILALLFGVSLFAGGIAVELNYQEWKADTANEALSSADMEAASNNARINVGGEYWEKAVISKVHGAGYFRSHANRAIAGLIGGVFGGILFAAGGVGLIFSWQDDRAYRERYPW